MCLASSRNGQADCESQLDLYGELKNVKIDRDDNRGFHNRIARDFFLHVIMLQRQQKKLMQLLRE